MCCFTFVVWWKGIFNEKKNLGQLIVWEEVVAEGKGLKNKNKLCFDAFWWKASKWPVQHAPRLQSLKTVSKAWSVHVCVFVCMCVVLFGFYFSSGYEAYAATSSRCWNESALFSSDTIQHIAALIPLSSRDTRRNAGTLLSATVSYVKKRCISYSVTVRNIEIWLIWSSCMKYPVLQDASPKMPFLESLQKIENWRIHRRTEAEKSYIKITATRFERRNLSTVWDLVEIPLKSTGVT